MPYKKKWFAVGFWRIIAALIAFCLLAASCESAPEVYGKGDTFYVNKVDFTLDEIILLPEYNTESHVGYGVVFLQREPKSLVSFTLSSSGASNTESLVDLALITGEGNKITSKNILVAGLEGNPDYSGSTTIEFQVSRAVDFPEKGIFTYKAVSQEAETYEISFHGMDIPDSSSAPIIEGIPEEAVTLLQFDGGVCEILTVDENPSYGPANMTDGDKAVEIMFSYVLEEGASPEDVGALYRKAVLKDENGNTYPPGAALSSAKDSTYSLLFAIPKEMDVFSFLLEFEEQHILIADKRNEAQQSAETDSGVDMGPTKDYVLADWGITFTGPNWEYLESTDGAGMDIAFKPSSDQLPSDRWYVLGSWFDMETAQEWKGPPPVVNAFVFNGAYTAEDLLDSRETVLEKYFAEITARGNNYAVTGYETIQCGGRTAVMVSFFYENDLSMAAGIYLLYPFEKTVFALEGVVMAGISSASYPRIMEMAVTGEAHMLLDTMGAMIETLQFD